MSSILNIFTQVFSILENIELPLFGLTLFDLLKSMFLIWALVNVFMSKFFKSAISSVYETSQMKFDRDVKRQERAYKVRSQALNNFTNNN